MSRFSYYELASLGLGAWYASNRHRRGANIATATGVAAAGTGYNYIMAPPAAKRRRITRRRKAYRNINKRSRRRYRRVRSRKNRYTRPAARLAKRQNRNVKAVLNKAKADTGRRLVYDIFSIGNVSAEVSAVTKSYDVRISDFQKINGILGGSGSIEGTFAEYKVLKVWYKIKPLDAVALRNATTRIIKGGNFDMGHKIAVFPRQEEDSTISVTAQELIRSTGIKWISMFKSSATIVTANSYLMEKKTYNDGSDVVVKESLHKMPFMEYSTTATNNVKFAPIGLWVPAMEGTTTPNNTCRFDIEVHIVAALRGGFATVDEE